ncbi:hypothetical protein GCM10010246_85020 [Streptomyces cuspidosporus]|uniref:Uncharacterized protein n=1 Tax=Streptomyces cuspidosporus TaxID=66882 RepID=A0ABN3HEC0_9ACTN
MDGVLSGNIASVPRLPLVPEQLHARRHFRSRRSQTRMPVEARRELCGTRVVPRESYVQVSTVR